VREGWESSLLVEHIKFIDYRGRTPKKIDEGMRLITAKNVKMGFLQIEPKEFVDPNIYQSWMTRGIPKKGDVLFTTEAPLGNVAQLDTDEKVVFAQRVIIMQPNRDVLEPTFLKYMLLTRALQSKLQEKATGATARGIKASLLKKIEITFPSISKQERIVAILDEAFEGINQAIANTEKNFTNARELFESYLNNILTQKGDGWVDTTLSELCDKVEYGTSSKSTPEGRVPVIRMGNVQNGSICWDNLVYTDKAEDIKKYILKNNDILFNRTNSAELVGKTAIYRNEKPAIFAGYLIRLHRKEDLIDADFLNYYLNSIPAREYGKTVMSRSINQANINGTKLKGYPISIPKLVEQKEIVERVREIQESTKQLQIIYQQKLAALTELKQSILQKAFTGELNKETEQLVANG
jgi:type I restriction enzyme, S subunit